MYAVEEEPQSGGYAYELAVQHCRPARTFVVLTSEGVTRVRKRRPLDVLRRWVRREISRCHPSSTKLVMSC